MPETPIVSDYIPPEDNDIIHVLLAGGLWYPPQLGNWDPVTSLKATTGKKNRC